MLRTSSRFEPSVEVLHGVTISDSYRWLEDRASCETEAWINQESDHYERYCRSLPSIHTLRSSVAQFLNVESVDQPALVGNVVFLRRRKENEQQPSICCRDSHGAFERILVDPAIYGPFVSVAIEHIAEDARNLAFTLRRGGAKPVELHFVDVATGTIFEDSLCLGIPGGVAFSSGGDGFFYCHELTDRRVEQPHEIRYHRFGTPIFDDEVVLSLPRTDLSRLFLISDRTLLGALRVYQGTSGMSQMDFYVSSKNMARHWKPILQATSRLLHPFFHAGGLYALSFDDFPNGQIVELETNGDVRRVVVPQSRTPIRGFHVEEACLYTWYEDALKTAVHRWNWQGGSIGVLPEVADESLYPLPSYSSGQGTLFFHHESFRQSASILQYSASDEAFIRAPFCAKPSQLLQDLRIERIAYASKDGTEIPMWLLSCGAGTTPRARPCLLTGYGGFGISVTPRFSVLVAIMLKLGCVFALPNIRGGSEFGKEWRAAAQGTRRQVAFDDFIAAADWLCDTGVTSPSQLGIFGASNAGLLVAAAMTQRPSLFRAVICIAPLLDMLRYEFFDDARKWVEEYGTVSVEEDFRALHAYSPYHNVKAEVNYPATLFVTGDSDVQCNPAHVRKMAALLKGRASQWNPILVDYSAERGHSACLPLDVRIEALARRIAFLCHELGVHVPDVAAL